MKRPVRRWLGPVGASLLAFFLACAKSTAPAGDTCFIPTAGLTPIAYTADCLDPTGSQNTITIAKVLGTAPELANGQRYSISGSFNLPDIKTGELDLYVGCGGSGAFEQCNRPFGIPKGKFEMRLETTACAEPSPATEILIRVWDPARGAVWPFCIINLETPVDDDASPADDDVSPADDDVSPADDDASPADDDASPA